MKLITEGRTQGRRPRGMERSVSLLLRLKEGRYEDVYRNVNS